MAYLITRTDGSTYKPGTTQPWYVNDGTIDNTTSLTLFGKSYSGFGELLNEDLVRLLENSASTAAPASPMRGELWFDTATNQLKVFDGSAFKPASGAKSQATAPTSPTAGDLWVDSDDKQLYFYTGSAWQLAGPVYTDGQQLSGFKIETVGSGSGDKVVAAMYSGTIRVAILSASTFTPTSSLYTANGFATIAAGLTLNSTLGAEFSGSTTTANNLNTTVTTGQGNGAATTVGGGNFLRNDVSGTLDGTLTINDNTGIVLGTDQEAEFKISSHNLIIENTSEDKNISLKANDGASYEAVTIDGMNRRVGIFTTSPTVPFEITGNVKITGNLSVSGEYDTTSTTNVTMNDVFLK